MNNEIKILSTKTHGDMALCNLASINLMEWYYQSEQEQYMLCKTCVDALDLAIEIGQCPIIEGQITNNLYKYMGVGVTNLANLLASKGFEIDSAEAAEFQDMIFDDLSFQLYTASMERAKLYGAFPKFNETKWRDGITPVHQSLKHNISAWKLTEYGRNFVKEGRLDRWDKLGAEIKKHGIRNAQVMAIAPTANSAKAINATESTEPVMNLMYKEEGVRNITALAPNIREHHMYYKPAFECNQKALVTNAIIRQKYIDQAQSITLYLKKADSLKELTELHNYGFQHGIKTFYYLKQQKFIDGDTEAKMDDMDCVACSV